MKTLTALLPIVWLLAFLSPLPAMIFASVFYHRSCRKWPDADGRLTVVAFGLILLVCGVVAYSIGVLLGINWACPSGGNLCGLAGFFIVGPVASAVAVLVMGGLLSWRVVSRHGDPVEVLRDDHDRLR